MCDALQEKFQAEVTDEHTVNFLGQNVTLVITLLME